MADFYLDEDVVNILDDNWNLLEKQDFDALYSKVSNRRYTRNKLTMILLHVGINPLDYFKTSTELWDSFADGCGSYFKDKSIDFSTKSFTKILTAAFYNCGLGAVNLNGIESIGGHAFRKNNLKEIIIPSSVGYVGELSFAYNDDCEKIIIENPNCLIATGAFTGSTSKLKEFQLPEKYWNGIQLRYITGIKNTIPFKKSGVKFKVI